LPTVRAADAGKAAARVAAIQVAFHHILDDRSEEAVLLLEAVFILRKEPVKIMEEHAVEDGALRMPRPVDSCHTKDRNSRNEPKA